MNYKLEKDELEQIESYLKNEKIIGIKDIFNKHTVIVLVFAKAILQKLGKDFDFFEYEKFDFDKSILKESED